MANREGFAITEAAMGVLSVTTLLTMVVLIGVESSLAVSGVSAARSDRNLEVTRADLERFTERQISHYLKRSEFAVSADELRFEESDGVSITVRASGSGWSASAVHDALGGDRGCAVFFGREPAGTGPVQPTAPGQVACTQ